LYGSEGFRTLHTRQQHPHGSTRNRPTGLYAIVRNFDLENTQP
jgi:hypothetical protein